MQISVEWLVNSWVWMQVIMMVINSGYGLTGEERERLRALVEIEMVGFEMGKGAVLV